MDGKMRYQGAYVRERLPAELAQHNAISRQIKLHGCRWGLVSWIGWFMWCRGHSPTEMGFDEIEGLADA